MTPGGGGGSPRVGHLRTGPPQYPFIQSPASAPGFSFSQSLTKPHQGAHQRGSSNPPSARSASRERALEPTDALSQTLSSSIGGFGSWLESFPWMPEMDKEKVADEEDGETLFQMAVRTLAPWHSENVPVTVDCANNGTQCEPWLMPEQQRTRRLALGLGPTGKAGKFADGCEFVSLGSYCAVSRSLQCLGLKKHSYPFDWTRSSAAGIVQCVENNFKDFLTYSLVSDKSKIGLGTMYGDTNWGGSFWHHDITKAKVKADFHRRIDRMLGRGEVPANKPRVFVRAVNCTQELNDIWKMRRALRRTLHGCKVHVLVLIDCQPTAGAIRVRGNANEDLLFYRVHDGLFANKGASWTMEGQSNAYAEAVALAVRFWAGRPDAAAKVEEVNDAQQLASMIMPFFGGDPGRELFYPQRSACCPPPGTSPSRPHVLTPRTAAGVASPRPNCSLAEDLRSRSPLSSKAADGSRTPVSPHMWMTAVVPAPSRSPMVEKNPTSSTRTSSAGRRCV